MFTSARRLASRAGSLKPADFNARVLYHGGLSEAIRIAYWPALADPEALKQRVGRVMAERQAAHTAPQE